MSNGKNDRAAKVRRIVTWTLFVVGLVLIVLSLAAEFFGLNITPGFGMVQMFQLLVGLTALTLALFLFINVRRQDMRNK